MNLEIQEPEALSVPKLPKQLWGLWTGKTWVRAIDCAGDPVCAYASQQDAECGRASAKDMYDIDSVVVLIFQEMTNEQEAERSSDETASSTDDRS